MSAVTHARPEVEVFYGAESKDFGYTPQEQVEALLSQAEDAFHITTNRHLMSLFTESGQELPDHSSLEGSKVVPGEKLILRQSSVKGG